VHITIEIDAAPEQLMEELASLAVMLNKLNSPIALTEPKAEPKAKTPPPPPAPKAKAKAADPEPEPIVAWRRAGWHVGGL